MVRMKESPHILNLYSHMFSPQLFSEMSGLMLCLLSLFTVLLSLVLFIFKVFLTLALTFRNQYLTSSFIV